MSVRLLLFWQKFNQFILGFQKKWKIFESSNIFVISMHKITVESVFHERRKSTGPGKGWRHTKERTAQVSHLKRKSFSEKEKHLKFSRPATTFSMVISLWTAASMRKLRDGQNLDYFKIRFFKKNRYGGRTIFASKTLANLNKFFRSKR